MAINFLYHKSLIMDSVVLALLAGIFIILSAVTLVIDGFERQGVLFKISLILTIMSCAYGIPISKVRKGYDLKFTITAIVFAGLGLTGAIINTIINQNSKSIDALESTGENLLGIFTEIILAIAAALMFSKYSRTCRVLRMEQQAAQPIAQQPHVMVVQENINSSLYPTQTTVQPMMVGQPQTMMVGQPQPMMVGQPQPMMVGQPAFQSMMVGQSVYQPS